MRQFAHLTKRVPESFTVVGVHGYATDRVSVTWPQLPPGHGEAPKVSIEMNMAWLLMTGQSGRDFEKASEKIRAKVVAVARQLGLVQDANGYRRCFAPNGGVDL